VPAVVPAGAEEAVALRVLPEAAEAAAPERPQVVSCYNQLRRGRAPSRWQCLKTVVGKKSSLLLRLRAYIVRIRTVNQASVSQRYNAPVEHLLRATAQAETRHFWFRGFRSFVTPLLESATSGRSDARLLDCGCGTGANLELLSRFGRAFGFDLSETGLRLGRAAGRMHLAQASVDAAPFPAGRFDLVTSFDVLYSLDDMAERSAIAEMFRMLKPGGFAVINVAAMRALRGDHSVLSREVRRYDREDLRVKLQAAGFTIVRLTYTNASLFLPMAIVRGLQRRRGLKPEGETRQEISVPPGPVNAALSVILRIESAWLRWFDLPFGSSLLCLAQKPSEQVSDSSRVPRT
jgi:SAM-dependent methyltransferase